MRMRKEADFLGKFFLELNSKDKKKKKRGNEKRKNDKRHPHHPLVHQLCVWSSLRLTPSSGLPNA